MCVLIRMIIRNNDGDYYHHCALYLWGGRGSELCRHDLGASHSPSSRMKVASVTLQVRLRGTLMGCSGPHSHTSERRKPHPRPCTATSSLGLMHLIFLIIMFMDSASGASLGLNVSFGI